MGNDDGAEWYVIGRGGVDGPRGSSLVLRCTTARNELCERRGGAAAASSMGLDWTMVGIVTERDTELAWLAGTMVATAVGGEMRTGVMISASRIPVSMSVNPAVPGVGGRPVLADDMGDEERTMVDFGLARRVGAEVGDGVRLDVLPSVDSKGEVAFEDATCCDLVLGALSCTVVTMAGIVTFTEGGGEGAAGSLAPVVGDGAGEPLACTVFVDAGESGLTSSPSTIRRPASASCLGMDNSGADMAGGIEHAVSGGVSRGDSRTDADGSAEAAVSAGNETLGDNGEVTTDCGGLSSPDSEATLLLTSALGGDRRSSPEVLRFNVGM